MNEARALIMAAGKGTRMRSALPKAAHEITGIPMLAHVMLAARDAGIERSTLIVGHGAEQLQASIESISDQFGLSYDCTFQEQQLGTGDAVRGAIRSLAPDATSTILILSADMPLITPATIRSLLDQYFKDDALLTLLSTRVDDPTGYGRVVRNDKDRVIAVREQKELAPSERSIDEINCGVYVANFLWLQEAIEDLQVHVDGEYYLPDLIQVAAGIDRISAYMTPSTIEGQGINTRQQLAQAEVLMQSRINALHMDCGVTMEDPSSTYINSGVTIGMDTIIRANTHLRGRTRIEDNCIIGPDSELVNAVVGTASQVTRSVVESSVIGARCLVGPWSHLRVGAELADGVKIGNFAEVKNSVIGSRSVSHHFSYIGDTSMGANVNIGAGTVTANFDGTTKHRTEIGDNSFVGSGTMLRAPVRLGAGSQTGAGSVVTRDVPPGTTVAGVPAREIGRPSRPAVDDKTTVTRGNS